MSQPHVRIEVSGGVATLTLCNPDMNRLSRDLLSGLSAALPQLRAPAVRAVVLVADGPVFSYGADVKGLFVDLPRDSFGPILGDFLEFIHALEALPKPTIEAVHGVCSSGGLALAFDHLGAASGTKLGFMEPSLAIPPLAGGPQRIAVRAGVARAMEIATSGRLYEAEQFERWNVVGRVVPPESLRSEATAFAAKLAQGPTLAYAAVKTLLRRYESHGIADADQATPAAVVPVMDSRDAAAAITALMAGQLGKEPLNFRGE